MSCWVGYKNMFCLSILSNKKQFLRNFEKKLPLVHRYGKLATVEQISSSAESQKLMIRFYLRSQWKFKVEKLILIIISLEISILENLLQRCFTKWESKKRNRLLFFSFLLNESFCPIKKKKKNYLKNSVGKFDKNQPTIVQLFYLTSNWWEIDQEIEWKLVKNGSKMVKKSVFDFS